MLIGVLIIKSSNKRCSDNRGFTVLHYLSYAYHILSPKIIIIFHIYLIACRHGTKAGVLETYYEGHQGPVTGISAHAVQGGIDFSDLFLTSSIDWTIKLWSLRLNKPLYSFEHNGDYVYNVAWSPTHPALFAAVDDSGRLDLWNLNQDTEVPTASVMIDGCPALNRVSWTPSGLHVTVGDDTGKIWVYDVAEVSPFQLMYARTDCLEFNTLNI